MQDQQLHNVLSQSGEIGIPIRIFLLGEPRLEIGEQTIILPHRERLVSLFARLVLQPGKILVRKKLAFDLWPDESEAEALANLRRHLYLIRNFLPSLLQKQLVITPQTVSWQDPSLCWVDVREFQQADGNLESIEHAVKLYCGDLASGVDGDDFLVAQRAALQERFLHLLKQLAEGYTQRGELKRASEWVRRLLERDPWDEEMVRLKMVLEVQTGNRAAALATYQHLADELERELGTQPMPETMALYSDILHNRLVRPHPPAKSAAPLFIGRERELNQLASLFQNLPNQQGITVFIGGPAGVGKTYLLQEALRRLTELADESAPRVFWASCSPPTATHATLPYAPWIQILNAAAPLLVRDLSISAEWLSHLLPLVPDLALLRPALLAFAQPNAADLCGAIRQALHALALHRPLILVIEDVHWADEASLVVLQELATTCQSLPLLLLITHRLDELPSLLFQIKRTLRQQRRSVEIPLQVYTPDETRLFLKTFLGKITLSSSLYDEIIYYTHGLPLLLREAVEHIIKAHDQYPSLLTLQDSIRFRLKQLPQSARQMLEGAAILGFSFPAHELKALLEWPEASYITTLDALQSERLLLETSLSGRQEYTFSHHLIHNIILESIPPSRSVSLHQQAAYALQRVHANESGFAHRIATHYQSAGLCLPAARFWLKHARENTDLAAFDPALEAIERAESLIGNDSSLESRELRAQAALQRGVIAYYRGQTSVALVLLKEALYLSSNFPLIRAHALAQLAYALYTSDRYAESWQSADESLLLARTLTDSQAIICALNIRGMTSLILGHAQEAIRDFREALSIEANSAPSVQTVQSLNYLGTALVFAQDYMGATEILTKTRDLAHRGGLRHLEAAALTMQGQIALNCGRYSQSIETYRQAIELAGDSNLPGLWGKFAGRGAAYLHMGWLHEAKSDFERGLEIARQVGSRYGELLIQTYLSFTAIAAGNTPQHSLSALEEESAALGLHPVAMMAALYRARLWRLMGDFEQAIAAHRRAGRAAQATNVPQFMQKAHLEWLYTQSHLEIVDQELLTSLSMQAQTSGEVPHQILAKMALAMILRFENRFAEAMTVARESLVLAHSCPDAILTGEAFLLLMHLGQTTDQAGLTCSQLTELFSLAQMAFAPIHLSLKTASAPAVQQILLSNI